MEARAISSLNHPNICHLYDIGSQDGIDYLVMEFLEGETLAERLRKGPLPLNEILKIGIAVAEALSVAHPGDCAPRSEAGEHHAHQSRRQTDGLWPGQVRGRCSWSIERAITVGGADHDRGQSNLSSDQCGYGTRDDPIHVARADRGQRGDARSDLFALGGVFYEMLTGSRAFEGKSQISVASAILEKEPESISKTQPLTPPAFEHLVHVCLAKNPDDRYRPRTISFCS